MTRPCRLQTGDQRIGICPSCRLEDYQTRTPDGWRCSCGHTYTGRFRAPIKTKRRIDAQHAIRLYADKHSISSIARELGCSICAVNGILARAGIKKGGKGRPKQQGAKRPDITGRPAITVPDDLLDLYPTISAYVIADMAGVSHPTVYRRLRERGATITNARGQMRMRHHCIIRSADAVARATEARTMRFRGLTWGQVAYRLGYASPGHAIRAVRMLDQGLYLAQQLGRDAP